MGGQRTATWLGLVIALGAPPLFGAISFQFPDVGIAAEIALQALYCALVPLIAWIVLRWEHRSLRSIGLRPFRWSSVLWGLALWGFLSFVLSPLTASLVSAFGADGLRDGVSRLAAYPRWFLVLLGATAGIVEETLYRGYALERLGTLTGRLWLGGAISAAAFTFAHVLFWGLAFTLAADLPFALAMTGFYLWRRDLVANAMAHSLGLIIALPAATAT